MLRDSENQNEKNMLMAVLKSSATEGSQDVGKTTDPKSDVVIVVVVVVVVVVVAERPARLCPETGDVLVDVATALVVMVVMSWRWSSCFPSSASAGIPATKRDAKKKNVIKNNCIIIDVLAW